MTILGLCALLAGCVEDRRGGLLIPDEPPLVKPPPAMVGAEVRCQARVYAERLVCQGVDPAAQGALAPLVVVGGQTINVTMASTNVVFNSTTRLFQAMVTVQNHLPQPLGTADGESVHPDGVRVFFHTGPTNGVTVANADGTGTFTGIDQPYFRYGEILFADDVSPSRQWRWEVPIAVDDFVFTVFVIAPVQHEAGWVDLSPGGLAFDPADPAAALEATVRNVLGSPIAGAAITWSSDDEAVATVDEDGNVTPLGAGSATITASSAPRSPGTATVVVGDPDAVALVSITPDPMVEGSFATLNGSGFHPDPGENAVTVGGAAATVISATATELVIRVPDRGCLPAQDATVEVTVAGNGSDDLSHPIRPASFVDLAVGEQLIIPDPTRFCLQFAEAAGNESYLVGVQRVSEAQAVETDARLTGVAAASPGMAPAALARSRVTGSSPTRGAGSAMLLGGLTPSHLRYHTRYDLAGSARPAGRAWSAASPTPPVYADLEVDDPVTMRVPNFGLRGAEFCDDTDIPATVRAVGTNVVFLEDDANPEFFDAAHFASFIDTFEDDVYPTLLDYFGTPTDLDGNDKILVLITREINARGGNFGFVMPEDWASQNDCGASSEGEVVYLVSPDPDGDFGPAEITVASLAAVVPQLLAHHVTHVIQFGRRIDRGQTPGGPGWPTVWELEGQANFAEEVAGHAVLGNQPGQNYDAAVAFTSPWYVERFLDHLFYFGHDPPNPPFDFAPQRCNWLSGAEDNPCNGSLEYGVAAILFRYLSDHVDEMRIHSDLIDSDVNGFLNVERATHLPMGVVLARWAAMLVVDGTIVGAPAELTLPSWDLADIFDNFLTPLTPHEESFADFVHDVTVRSGSTAYHTISGAGRPATAIRVRTPADGVLPSATQIWIVRLE